MNLKALFIAASLAIVLPFGIAVARDNERARDIEARDNTSLTVTETETEAKDDDQSQTIKERVEQAKQAAQEKVEHARQAAQERKIALKQDKCETRKQALQNKLPNLSQSVASIKTVLDTKYDKVKQIYESGKLSVKNYAELDAEVQVKQQAAQAAVNSVDPGTITIDCNDTGLGVRLDSYRSTVKAAKAALKEYHTALVALVSGLNAAADKAQDGTTAAGETAEGGN